MTIFGPESYDQYAKHDAVRSSHVLAYLTSPQLYQDQLTGLAERKSKAMEFGTASHMAVLEPKRFFNEGVVQPDVYTNDKGDVKPWTYAATSCKEWRTLQETNGKFVISRTDLERIILMHKRMPAEVKTIFKHGVPEVVYRNDLLGVPCQCRADWLVIDRFYEFKTIRNMDGAENEIHKRRYYIQNAFYRRVMEPDHDRGVTSRIVFAETQAPFRWRIMELDLDYVALGDAAVTEALSGIAARRKSGVWDDAESVNQLVSPPTWMEVSEQTEDEEI